MNFRFPWICVFLRSVRSQDGQALVETSFATSILLLILLGGAELARVAYCTIEVANAAKAAAQYAAQNSGTAANLTAIQAAASSDASDLSGLSTSVSTSGICSDGSACTGSGGACLATDCSSSHIETILTVQTSAAYKPLLQVRGLPVTFTLHGQAVQKVLNY